MDELLNALIERYIMIIVKFQLCSCNHTLPNAIQEIFSEFSIFCNLIAKYEKRGKYFQNCTRQRVLTTLSLNAC